MSKTQSPLRQRDSCFRGDIPGVEERKVVCGVAKLPRQRAGKGSFGSSVYLAAAGSRSRWKCLRIRAIKAPEVSSLLRRRAREKGRSL